MKLNQKDNINLMKECCIVREIECTQGRKDSLASKFCDLKETLKHSKNVNFEELHKDFDDCLPIKSFLTEMEKKNKFRINLKYYQKAVKCAEKYNSQREFGELTSKIKQQFFRENRIKNLNVRFHQSIVKYVGMPLATLLATGTTLYGIHTFFSDKNLEEPQAIETTVPIPEQEIPSTEINKQPITGIDDLDVHDTSFEVKMKNDFKSFYAEEFNASNHETSITPDNLKIDFNNSQDYVYKVKVGNEYRLVSHGDYPAMIQKYFENNNTQPETISHCNAISVYLIDADGNIQKDYDEFGNLTNVKLDSAMNGQQLYDGNNPKGLLNPKSSSQSLLAEMKDVLSCLTLSMDTENDRQIVKDKYINAVKNYQASKELTQNEFESEYSLD